MTGQKDSKPKQFVMSRRIKVVGFGGGTGLPTLLSGLKRNPWLEVTAIPTMFDTGGSSGELAHRFGVLPFGDALKCIIALSSDEEAAAKLLLRRISHRASPGHTAGNILLLGLEKVFGDFMTAVNVLGQIVSSVGVVYPVALSQSTLCAEFEDQTTLRGETSIDIGIFEGKRVKRLFLDPPVPSNELALNAIRKADVFCVGPGSFYTSVLSNFLPEGVRAEIKASSAPVVFTSNLLTEGYGMNGFTARGMTEILEAYIDRCVSKVIVNTRVPQERLEAYAEERKYPLSWHDTGEDDKFILADLWFDARLARHDTERLSYLMSQVIYDLVREKLAQ